MKLARLIDKPALGYGKVGRILISVVTVAALVAIAVFVPGSAFAASFASSIGVTAAQGATILVAIGSVAISLASSLLTGILFRPKSDMSAAKINVRIEAPQRWIAAGKVLLGGGVNFAEFDSQGNLWWIIIHSDSIANGPFQYYLDSKLVTVSGNNVTSPDFMRKGKSYFRIWTHTYSETDPVPTGATELAAALPSLWDVASHQLVGTTYSVICGLSIKLDNRYKVYRWRGPLGMGEPNVALLADWSNMYDPRDPEQTLGDRSTYKPSRNNSLIWAWWRTHPYGMKKPESEVNWDMVAEQADICDQTVVGIESTQPRYECAIAARDDVGRGDIQTQIMLACDGQIVFDDEGKSWMRAGHYHVPTLSLSRNRDIIAMESIEAQDGESETQGVVVRFLDHLAEFTTQPSAAWRNPNYYKPNEGNTFLTVDIPTIYNHNQAMRVAKSIGMRSQPLQKLAPTTGLRGLRAMQERFVDINYDNTFAGDYEIISPVEIDESGMFCSLALVPVGPDRFDLLAGEERARPNGTTTETTVTIDPPSGVTVMRANNRIEARFDAPDREDVRYEFQYINQSDYTDAESDPWGQMQTDMDALFAFSGVVDQNVPQYVRWRAVSSGGTDGAWSTLYSLGSLAMPPVTDLSVTPDTGSALLAWKNPTDARFFGVDVFRSTTPLFGDATQVLTNYGGALGEVQWWTNSVAPGTYYWWVRATDGASLFANPTGPVSATVT